MLYEYYRYIIREWMLCRKLMILKSTSYSFEFSILVELGPLIESIRSAAYYIQNNSVECVHIYA